MQCKRKGARSKQKERNFLTKKQVRNQTNKMERRKGCKQKIS